MGKSALKLEQIDDIKDIIKRMPIKCLTDAMTEKRPHFFEGMIISTQ